MNLFSLEGKNVVVVGGAGGLGVAVVRGLAEHGAAVAIADILTGPASALADELTTNGYRVKSYTADATSEDSLSQVCSSVLSDFGSVDVLVNAVGGNKKDATISESGSFFDISTSALQDVVNFNLFAGAVLPAKVFGKAMASNTDGGSIINISSVVGLRPFSRVGGYCAAKAAVINFTQWLAVTLAKTANSNIRVNSIAPGVVLTEQNRYLLTDENGGLTERGKSVVASTPMSRMGSPSDLVGTVIWLASDASRFITGIVVPVDGGFCAFSGV